VCPAARAVLFLLRAFEPLSGVCLTFRACRCRTFALIVGLEDVGDKNVQEV
jgi:hypothetical protein